ncbi:MAG TPA: hypothetical protein VGN69_08655 [Solirubrobacteraceae bacterium]|jgi:hypothetical protein|nr:hypothetical protein [Solirubrobacteraceae bacterium]
MIPARLTGGALAITAAVGMLFLAACGGGQAARASALAPSLHIGLVDNTLDYGPGGGREQDAARQTGARWLREEFRWSEVEPHPGRLHWDRYDQLVLSAARRGLHLLPLLIASPRWESSAALRLPVHSARFARFAAAVARRYGPHGAFWRSHRQVDGRLAARRLEVWNEPYYLSSSVGGVAPARYARLVRAAAISVARANSRVSLLLAADTTYIAPDGRVLNWLDALYRAVPDLSRYYAAVAVHPYSDGPPDQYTPPSTRGQFSRIDELRRTLADHGAGAKHLWITEVGWSTCPRGPRCVSEAQQADYLGRLLGLLGGRYRRIVDALFVYRLRDLDPGTPSEREQWFGIMRRDGTRKPAWHILARAAGVER